MGEWQDISTAPKGGTTIDLWADGRFTDAEWGQGHNERGFEQPCWFVSNGYDGWCEPVPSPTHWMPLPDGPKLK